MFRNIFLGLIFFLMLMAIGRCTPQPHLDLQVYQQDAGKTFELRQGDTLTIYLPGNPATGYTWEPLSQDPALLSQLEKAEFIPASNLLGGNGMMSLRFKAVKKGESALTLGYRRPWETDVDPAELFTIHLLVR